MSHTVQRLSYGEVRAWVESQTDRRIMIDPESTTDCLVARYLKEKHQTVGGRKTTVLVGEWDAHVWAEGGRAEYILDRRLQDFIADLIQYQLKLAIGNTLALETIKQRMVAAPIGA